ncbi:MAG TPA: hypothetical protein PKH39_11440 [Woeseiaceae bacterium]|nr:hypothetical protein [Woeseiaceae bacterium]
MADFSLFDSLNPVLAMIDRILTSLSLAPVWRMAVFAALGSLVSMLLFKKLSNQAELAELKQKIGQAQKDLVRSNDKSAGLGQVLRRNLRLSGRQLWISFWPALIASIPILFLLVFCSNQFGAKAMDSGARVYVTPVELEGSPRDYRWTNINAQWDARKMAWTFYQPEPGKSASLVRGAEPQLSVPTVAPTHVVHKKQWWNFLIANPAGYIDDNAGVERFEFNTPTQVIINWGPGWMRGWLFAFMLFLVLFSVAIKILWKIH